MLQSIVAPPPPWAPCHQRLVMMAAAVVLLIASLLGPAMTDARFASGPPALVTKVSSVDKALARIVRQLVTRTAKAPTRAPAASAVAHRPGPALRP